MKPPQPSPAELLATISAARARMALEMLVTAIERAAEREHECPRDDMVARLDCILEEFANILGAYIEFKRAAQGETRVLDLVFPEGVPFEP